jgi:hypothetical protein
LNLKRRLLKPKGHLPNSIDSANLSGTVEQIEKNEEGAIAWMNQQLTTLELNDRNLYGAPKRQEAES